METSRKTTAGTLSWTLAPVRTSPTSSAISEDAWDDDDEDEDEAERGDDFAGHMDENGVIGLADALEEFELSESRGSEWESDRNVRPGPIGASPHLVHFTAEEMAAGGPGIDAESLPEVSLAESPPESHRSRARSGPRRPAAASGHCGGVEEASLRSGKPRKPPTPSPRKTRQHSPGATKSLSLNAAKVDSLKYKPRTASPDRVQKTPRDGGNAAEMDESRKGPLSYRTPDFSKVEPKVHFPKDGYSPPKSKHPSPRAASSPGPPAGFKSPVDIVKEVLLKTIDGSLASRDSSYKPTGGPPDAAAPQEVSGRQQTTGLLDQLQEDYNRLLTKYAEAENTIDRLRLRAKVNLYSDPPRPGHLLQSALTRDPSPVTALDFTRPQRAALSSAPLHPDAHANDQRSSSATRSPDPQVGEQLAKIIYSQADRFLRQMQSFKDLLKSNRLLPSDQMKALSQLAEGLNCLERGYLLAKDEHKVLLQRGAQISPFDSERELEGLIFQCGLCMEELKEQVGQMQQEQPTCVAPPSPPPRLTPSPASSEGGETPQSPPVPLLVDPGEAAAMEVSSASEESPEEDEETLNSLYLKPLDGKQRLGEQDFTTLTDHEQSFKELPKVQDGRQRGGASLSAAFRSDRERDRPSPRAEDGPPQREDESERLDSPPVKQQAGRSGPPSRRASAAPPPLGGSRRSKVGGSHSSSLSSLGDITALEERNSKRQTGSSGVLSQDGVDGVVSPETDSGCVCSESSRLTPAAAASPLHQRAPESVSAPQEGILGDPQRVPVPSPASSSSSSSRSRVAAEPWSDDQRRGTRSAQRRRHTETSESGLERDGPHPEDRHNRLYTESMDSLRSSSPAGRLSSGQVANRNGAIQKLQAEVARLRDRIEVCVRTTSPPPPPSPVRAAPSGRDDAAASSTPRIRSGQRWCDVRGRRDGRTGDEVEGSAARRAARTRTPSAHGQKPPPPHVSLGSEPSSPGPRPLVSRCTQTSIAAPGDTDAERSRTHTRRHLGAWDTADEPDGRGLRAPLCPRCSSRHRGRPELGGAREPAHPFCTHCCLLWGHTEPSSSTEPPAARCRPHRDDGHFAAADPPALVQYMPVYPPPLLMYSSPLYASPSHSTPPGVGGRWKDKERTRPLPPSDRRRRVTGSLDRAIGAARHMRHTSGHMARSLATGVQYQELLTRTCSYQTADSSHRQHGPSHLRGSSSPRAEGTECRTR